MRDRVYIHETNLESKKKDKANTTKLNFVWNCYLLASATLNYFCLKLQIWVFLYFKKKKIIHVHVMCSHIPCVAKSSAHVIESQVRYNG